MSRGAIHYADMPPGPTPLITGAGEKVTITAFPHEVTIILNFIIIVIIIPLIIIILIIVVVIILMQVHVSSILAIAQVENHPLFNISINAYHLCQYQCV